MAGWWAACFGRNPDNQSFAPGVWAKRAARQGGVPDASASNASASLLGRVNSYPCMPMVGSIR
jgi:hypothetical protein